MKPSPIKPEITIDDLRKLDIRIGTINSVEEVPESKPLELALLITQLLFKSFYFFGLFPALFTGHGSPPCQECKRRIPR